MLSDTLIHSRIKELQFLAENPDFPFSERQIQPCSVDIRLSEKIWVPSRAVRSLSLSPTVPLGRDVSDRFKSKRIKLDKGFKMAPGAFILARTYESFAIPNDLTAAIIGRSSIGRLGVSVSAPSGFINPGWRGHMPLMLINHAPFPIHVFPYVSICQLVLRQIDGEVASPYGQGDLGSKYQDDDGGPSRFWLDEAFKRVAELRNRSSGAVASDGLERFAAMLDEQTRRRLTVLLKRERTVENAQSIIESLCRNVRTSSLITTAVQWASGIFFAASIAIPRALSADTLISMLSAGFGMLAVLVGLIVWFRRSQLAPMTESEIRSIKSQCDWL